MYKNNFDIYDALEFIDVNLNLINSDMQKNTKFQILFYINKKTAIISEIFTKIGVVL